MLYDNYVRKRGPVNRFEWVQRNATTRATSASPNPEQTWRESGHHRPPYDGPCPPAGRAVGRTGGLATTSRSKFRHLEGGMRYDPGWAVVSRWRDFDEETGTYKAPIFTRDVLTAHVERATADTPRRSPAMSLDRTRRVDVDHRSLSCSASEKTTPAPCSTAWSPSLDDPDCRSQPPPRSRATCAPNSPPQSKPPTPTRSTGPYVAALREVQPSHEAGDIKVRPGAPGSHAAVIAAFAKDLRHQRSRPNIGSRWTNRRCPATSATAAS